MEYGVGISRLYVTKRNAVTLLYGCQPKEESMLRLAWCVKPTRGRWTLLVALVVTFAAAVLTSSATAMRLPPPDSGGGSLRQEAISIMSLNYKEFGWLRAHDPVAPFDWSSDGCSWTPPAWANLFTPACLLHDFGYRNFGNGLRLQRTEDRRAWIDGRFYTEMKRICNDKYSAWWYLANDAACHSEADAMYHVVRVASHW